MVRRFRVSASLYIACSVCTKIMFIYALERPFATPLLLLEEYYANRQTFWTAKYGF